MFILDPFIINKTYPAAKTSTANIQTHLHKWTVCHTVYLTRDVFTQFKQQRKRFKFSSTMCTFFFSMPYTFFFFWHRVTGQQWLFQSATCEQQALQTAWRKCDVQVYCQHYRIFDVRTISLKSMPCSQRIVDSRKPCFDNVNLDIPMRLLCSRQILLFCAKGKLSFNRDAWYFHGVHRMIFRMLWKTHSLSEMK